MHLDSLLSAMNTGILFVSLDDHVVYYNPAFLHIWMIPDGATLIGQPASEVLQRFVNASPQPDRLSSLLLRHSHDASKAIEIDMQDGRIVTQHAYPVRDAGDCFVGRLWLYEDVTREHHTAQQLIYLAERDSLTGLYNRHRFQEELERMVDDASRHDTQGALLFFDLDEFKYVNDTFGHGAGDVILMRIAGDIGAQVRRNETFCRLGGDEFAVLIPNTSENEAQALAERIVRSIAQIPFEFDGQSLRLTSSLGIAFYPRHANSAEELIAHADAAMYQAKEAGKNGWRIYRHDLDTSRAMIHRLTWNERIDGALEQGLLQLHFQGVYKTADLTLSHLEALVRMEDQDHPGKLIMPGHFIPIAEKSGKILDIDRWVIRAAIELLASSKQVPSIAVNISGRSFDEPALPQFIGELLHRHGVAPARLLVELPETSAVSDMQDAQRFIDSLRLTGCPVCLDDFGTGFSSFAYLKHLNVDVLKIDGLFIRDLANDRDNQIFVKAIVNVARGMNKITVAEFVESQEILDMLIGFGVDLVQGYHLDIPRA
ncbi:MAG: EAL domain-containing protein, partial [Planctomycetota bacterium]